MSFDTPRRYAAPMLDSPKREGAAPSEEEALLEAIRVELVKLGERATIRRTVTGHPFLCAHGVQARFNEEITTGRRDGRVRALWQWGDELPDDAGEAAAAIRRVINPAV